MNAGQHGKTTGIAFLFTILVFSMFATRTAYGLQSSNVVVSSTGRISNGQQIYVNVNPNNVIGNNKLSLGVQITNWDLLEFPSSAEYQRLIREANFKFIRFFDSETRIQPCKSWDDSSKTGTFDWAKVDAYVQTVYAVGAEPLVTLVHCGGGPTFNVPPGMKLNPQTGLPYPESLAAYCAEWVKHFNAKGWPVKYYEIINEVQFYLFPGGWVWSSQAATRVSYYMQLFNTCASAMRKINPNLVISFDFVTQKDVLDYWLSNGGAEIGSLNFHKYDSNRLGEFTDQQIFTKAENEHFGTWPLGRSVMESQQVYYNARGKTLPIICSETNMNAYFSTGTDSRIVQMTGAVWTALELRMEILNGVSFNVPFPWAASLSFEQNPLYRPDGGYGMGLINSDNNKPWYPYYVHKIIGSNLAVGDQILESTSASQYIRCLAWRNQGKLNILLICKTDTPQTVYLQGVTGQLNVYKIDNKISFTSASIQTGLVDSGQPFDMYGYTVALLQATSP